LTQADAELRRALERVLVGDTLRVHLLL
jgi:hypothetical protein